MVARELVGRPRARAGGFKAVLRAVVGRMGGHAGAWMFFGLVGSLRTWYEALGEAGRAHRCNLITVSPVARYVGWLASPDQLR